MIKKKSACVFLLFLLIATSCSQSSAQTEELAQTDPPPLSTQVESASVESRPSGTPIPSTVIPEPAHEGTLELSSGLVRGCDRHDGTDPKLREGDTAVDFSLTDVNGNSFDLSELLKEKPVAMIYGSFT